MVEPRDAGMVLITLRASKEVRAAAFGKIDGKIDGDMVAIAGTIIKRRSGHFDPATFRDRYQEALRELIEAKMKGLPVKPKQIATPAPVLDLMSALKRSLAQETGARPQSLDAEPPVIAAKPICCCRCPERRRRERRRRREQRPRRGVVQPDRSGHSNLSTSMIYARFNKSVEREALEQHGARIVQATKNL